MKTFKINTTLAFLGFAVMVAFLAGCTTTTKQAKGTPIVKARAGARNSAPRPIANPQPAATDDVPVPLEVAAPQPAPVQSTPLPPPTPQPAPRAAAPQPPVVVVQQAQPEPLRPQAAIRRVTYAAEIFFDLNKDTLRTDSLAKLDALVSKLNGLNLEVLVVVGHADELGDDAYNMGLSIRRAEAVKAYLNDKCSDKNRIYTEGKGKRFPIANNNSEDGRSKNRRAEIEVIGTMTASENPSFTRN